MFCAPRPEINIKVKNRYIREELRARQNVCIINKIVELYRYNEGRDVAGNGLRFAIKE